MKIAASQKGKHLRKVFFILGGGGGEFLNIINNLESVKNQNFFQGLYTVYYFWNRDKNRSHFHFYGITM